MVLPERALSIRQPWAWAIMTLGKDIENRSWETLRRGPICLHVGKGMTWTEEVGFFEELDRIAPEGKWGRQARLDAFYENDQRGGIIGIADIVDCVRESRSPWFAGPFGIVLANVRPVPFIPCKGRLSFFRWQAVMT